MNLFIRLALRHMAARRLRTTLTTIAIAFGVMILFGMNGLIPSVLQSFRQNLLAVVGQVDLTITNEVGGSFNSNVLDEVRQTEGVSSFTGSLQQLMVLPQPQPAGGITKPGLSSGGANLMINGIEPATHTQVRPLDLSSGRSINPDENDAIILSETFAKELNLGIGGTITLPSAQGRSTFRIVGLTQGRATPGNEDAYVSLAAAQDLFNRPGQITTIELMFKPGIDHTQLQADLKSRLGPTFRFGQPDVTSEFLASLNVGEVALSFFGVVALLMGGFIIFNTFRTIIAERRRELALLRAVGASRRTIINMILVESVAQGVLGTALGLLAGWAMIILLLKGVGPLFEQYLRFRLSDPVFNASSFISSIILGVGVTVVGGLYPAIQASKVSPIEALRPESVTTAAAARKSLIPAGVIIALSLIGLLSGDLKLTSLGLIFFLVGLVWITPALVHPIADLFRRLTSFAFAREGAIASGNISRQPGRSAITASALMIGLAVILSMGGLVASVANAFSGYIEKSMSADFMLLPQSLLLGSGNIGADPALAARVRNLPEVSDVATVRISKARTNNTDLQIIGVDPSTYAMVSGLVFSKGEEGPAYASMSNSRAIILNGIYSSKNNVAIGQELVLDTPTGEHTYKVTAIAMDYMNAKIATGYISQQNIAQDFLSTTDVLLMADLKQGASADKLKSELTTILQDYPAFKLYSATDWKNEQNNTFTMAFSVIYILMIGLATPSLLALINTLAINVIERTREIGVMRAIGTTRRQVQRLILAESLMLSGLGIALGILSGVWLSYVWVSAMSFAGFSMTFFFPGTGVLVTIGVGLLIGVVAAWVPARQAAKMDIIQALHYE